MGSIDVPFEIVVVCRRTDVLLHPGGYRLTTQAIKERGEAATGCWRERFARWCTGVQSLTR